MESCPLAPSKKLVTVRKMLKKQSVRTATYQNTGLTLWKVSSEGLLLYAWIIDLNGGHMNAWCRPPTHKIQYGCPAWPWHKSGRMPSVLQNPADAAAWPSSNRKKRGGSWRGQAQMEKTVKQDRQDSETGGQRRGGDRHCCAELQMLCSQSIVYYSKKKEK